jgi:hypothetical protein
MAARDTPGYGAHRAGKGESSRSSAVACRGTAAHGVQKCARNRRGRGEWPGKNVDKTGGHELDQVN